MVSERYDVIIIGSGPGGATMAWRLAKTGKRILLLERGDYLPRERENWDSQAVFVDARYQAKRDLVQLRRGELPSRACTTSSAATARSMAPCCFRLRERDFGEIRHKDGISPAWPLGYDEFEPYYQAAEELIRCTASAARTRPSRPHRSPMPIRPSRHEPRIQELFDGLQAGGAPSLPSARRRPCWTRRGRPGVAAFAPASAATPSTAIPA